MNGAIMKTLVNKLTPRPICRVRAFGIFFTSQHFYPISLFTSGSTWRTCSEICTNRYRTQFSGSCFRAGRLDGVMTSRTVVGYRLRIFRYFSYIN